MRFEHFDGRDVDVIDLRDPRRHLSGVSEVIVTAGHVVVMLAGSRTRSITMSELGFDSPDETPAYTIRSRANDEVHWSGPVRLSLT